MMITNPGRGEEVNEGLFCWNRFSPSGERCKLCFTRGQIRGFSAIEGIDRKVSEEFLLVHRPLVNGVKGVEVLSWLNFFRKRKYLCFGRRSSLC